jgi:dihydroflavonol-4-reductase
LNQNHAEEKLEMKILITGITGLLGSYLAREFVGKAEIYGFKRKGASERLLEGIEDQIQWYEGDLFDFEALESAVLGKDMVIHAAGMVSFDPRDEQKLYQVNTEGTTNLVNAMLSAGTSRLVHVSSVAAIGRSPELSVIDENHKWGESPFNTGYATSKYFAEVEAWRGEQEGLQLIVVNPSILLGKISDERSSTAIYSFVLDENNYFPAGDVNYLDVRDAAKMIRLLVEKNAWGERFILNRESIPYEIFFKKMADVFEKKPPFKVANGFLLKLAVFFIGFLRVYNLTKNPLNRQTAKLSQQKILYQNTKVNSFLNFEFTNLEETFKWAK